MIQIKKVLKVNSGDYANVLYNSEDGKEKISKRKLYNRKNVDWKVMIVEGHQFAVEFKDGDVASKVTYRGLNNQITKNGKQTEKPAKVTVNDEADKKVTFKVTKTIEMIKKQVIEQPKPQQVKHMKFNEIKACIEADVPVYLYGPAGSGKNHVLQQIAEELGLEFYFTNSVQQEYKITGFINAGGNYHDTEFYKAFTKGGLFFLDEIDASIPEVLVLLNAALANGYFEFPTGKVFAHKNFKVVAAGNTVGTGADEQYSGRLQLDQATLDRFAMIEFDYDRNIEIAISKNNIELVDFIRNLRYQAKEKGINATFSYRCITMVTKLEGKLELKEVLRMAVVKGLDADTVKTFSTTPANKYSKALWTLSHAS